MTRGQRLTFLGIAAVIAVVAVILLASGGDETDQGANSAQTATPTPTASATDGEETATPTPTPTATPKPPPLLQAGKVRTLTFDQGDTVRFRVRNDTAEEVHIHGYDITKELEPNKTETVSFKATITGIFEIELEGSATQIAELKVEP
jgi:FtsP/CotA-like multicopper oxidase with cupredoxin domain